MKLQLSHEIMFDCVQKLQVAHLILVMDDSEISKPDSIQFLKNLHFELGANLQSTPAPPSV